MRILRIQSIDDGDLGVAYLHKRASGKNSVNGSEMDIYLTKSDQDLAGIHEGLAVTLSKSLDLIDGHFLYFDEEDPLLLLKDNDGQFSAQVVRPGFISVSQSVSLWRPIRASVLTMSDKGSRGEREDRSGPALIGMLPDIGATLHDRAIVPDDQEAIRSKIMQWADEGSHLILLTGGTGLSKRDVTPEAVLSLTDRIIPGIGEAMRSMTAPLSPTAYLSRGFAATYRESLILALPGSERGAQECFTAVAPLLRHAVEILCGWSGECGGHRHH